VIEIRCPVGFHQTIMMHISGYSANRCPQYITESTVAVADPRCGLRAVFSWIQSLYFG
jgi:CxxC motif-containing protein